MSRDAPVQVHPQLIALLVCDRFIEFFEAFGVALQQTKEEAQGRVKFCLPLLLELTRVEALLWVCDHPFGW